LGLESNLAIFEIEMECVIVSFWLFDRQSPLLYNFYNFFPGSVSFLRFSYSVIKSDFFQSLILYILVHLHLSAFLFRFFTIPYNVFWLPFNHEWRGCILFRFWRFLLGSSCLIPWYLLTILLCLSFLSFCCCISTPLFVLEFFDLRGLLRSCGGILSIGSYVFLIAVSDSTFACSLAAAPLCCGTHTVKSA
jgi:hypothetical protein